MRTRLIVAIVAAVLATPSLSGSAVSPQAGRLPAAREGRVTVGNASLYTREVGQGPPAIVLHGGPDFDIGYLLPDLDRLADRFRLIYYDQRGRGKSADHVAPDDVTLASDVDDVDQVRQHFQLESTTLLGHSWGTVLALEYAVRHSTRVSRMILMNPAPASASDLALFKKAYTQRLGADLDRQRTIIASSAYQEGDPEAVVARYRLHFRPAFARADDFEKLMATMKTGFISQGNAGIVKARAVEDRLMRDTWNKDSYDLTPKLRSLNIPTLVIVGDHDFIPVEVAAHIASAIPNARLVTLRNCGHFGFLECPDQVRGAVDGFFRAAPAARRN
jgi:proline iminopeptidase